MREECHDIEDMGLLAELPDGDPRLAHVVHCAHCRGLLAAYRRFNTGCPEAGDTVREQALSEFLAREIGAPVAVADDRIPRPIPGFHRSRLLAPGLAVAAVLVLFLSLHEYRTTLVPESSLVTRGDSIGTTAVLQLSVGIEAAGGLALAWNALPGADRYLIVVYAADLQEVARLEAGNTTNLSLAADRLTELRQAPQPLIWRVLALAGGDRLTISGPVVLPDGGAP